MKSAPCRINHTTWYKYTFCAFNFIGLCQNSLFFNRIEFQFLELFKVCLGSKNITVMFVELITIIALTDEQNDFVSLDVCFQTGVPVNKLVIYLMSGDKCELSSDVVFSFKNVET